MRKAPLILLIVYSLAAFRTQVLADQNLTISIIVPKDGSYVYPDFELRWSISGDGNRTAIYVDGYAVKTDLGPSIRSYYLTGLANGSRKIMVRTIGTNNESAEDTIIVIVLTVPINFVILSPKEGFVTNSSSIVVTWNASGPIRQLKLWSNTSEVVLDKGLRSYNLTLGIEGELAIRLSAVDLRGPTITKTITFVHDNSSPVCEVISPTDGQVINQSILSAKWRSSDPISRVTKAEIYLDNAMISNITEGEKLLTDLLNGEHIIRVVAIDAAGNKGETSAIFMISVPFFARYGPIVVLIIVAGIGLMLFLSISKANSRRSKG